MAAGIAVLVTMLGYMIVMGGKREDQQKRKEPKKEFTFRSLVAVVNKTLTKDIKPGDTVSQFIYTSDGFIKEIKEIKMALDSTGTLRAVSDTVAILKSNDGRYLYLTIIFYYIFFYFLTRYKTLFSAYLRKIAYADQGQSYH
jgi:hypothetical protein